MSNIIEVDNVTYEYDNDLIRYSVLKNVSFNIESGSFVAVLGHNGSGKSTLAKLLNGLYKPTSGRVTVSGLDTNSDENDTEIKRTVGMIFQNPDNQIVATIVEEDVAFGLENIGVPSDEMRLRVDNALKAVDMYEHKDASPYNLSGGQKQRVAIAGVIAMEPKCIVLDEPTAMLDPKGRKDVINTITSLCRDKEITIILITHYMEEAAMADRIIVLDEGRIVLDGGPREVFANKAFLKDLGLDIPQASELACELAKNGLNINTSILTVDECVNEIVHLFTEEN